MHRESLLEQTCFCFVVGGSRLRRAGHALGHPANDRIQDHRPYLRDGLNYDCFLQLREEYTAVIFRQLVPKQECDHLSS